MSRSKAERDFIDQYTRKLLVDWCAHQIRFDTMPTVNGREGGLVECLEYARSKGWVSKKENKVLSTGFKTAAAFLRR